MWKPRAISPYMLPRPMPEMMEEASMAIRVMANKRARTVPRPLELARSVYQRQNFISLEVGKDVIRRRQGVLILRRERLVVGLDQPVILAELIEAFPNLRPLGRAGLGDRHR